MTEREAFEAWYKDAYPIAAGPLEVRGDTGEYYHDHTGFCFDAWQAATKAERSRCAGIARAIHWGMEHGGPKVTLKECAEAIAKRIEEAESDDD